MIIYEVNIKIIKTLYDDYIKWLDSHIELILKCDGFMKSKKFIYDESENFIYISIHYFVSSIEKLNYYLENNSVNMRNEGIKKFPNGIKIKRRILESIK